MATSPDTRPVRESEQLDWPRVESWLREHLAGQTIAGLDLAAPMSVEQFPGGHSNLTYLVRLGDAEVVLRRPPFGPVAPTAHDMAREFRWLAAVHPVFPLAPRVYALCEDPSLIGSVFYVMERRHGIVVRYDEPLPIKDRPDVRSRVSGALVDALAVLHSIDIEAAGLSHLGKPMGFVERQVKGWSERWHRSQTGSLPEMDDLTTWLARELPPNPAVPGIVHGDFKLDNVMLAAQAPDRLVAVFDWEMTALGDPLVDLGIFLAYWVAVPPGGARDALTTVTSRPGYFSRDQIIERYGHASTRDLSTLRYFEVFALFKIAVVIQQIYYRFVVGQTDDPRFAVFGDRVTALAREACRRI